MNKTLYILLSALVVIGLAACGAPTATSTPSFVATEAPAVITFVDPMLEAMIRAAIGQPEAVSPSRKPSPSRDWTSTMSYSGIFPKRDR